MSDTRFGVGSNPYSLDPARTTRPYADWHLGARMQPTGLQGATRAVLHASADQLMLAVLYLNGEARYPVKRVRFENGATAWRDGHDGRIMEIAASITFIEQHGLDARVIRVLHRSPLTEEDALAILLSGTSMQVAASYAANPKGLPTLATLRTLAALRGFTIDADKGGLASGDAECGYK